MEREEGEDREKRAARGGEKWKGEEWRGEKRREVHEMIRPR
jgi:hypothetical protein